MVNLGRKGRQLEKFEVLGLNCIGEKYNERKVAVDLPDFSFGGTLLGMGGFVFLIARFGYRISQHKNAKWIEILTTMVAVLYFFVFGEEKGRSGLAYASVLALSLIILYWYICELYIREGRKNTGRPT